MKQFLSRIISRTRGKPEHQLLPPPVPSWPYLSLNNREHSFHEAAELPGTGGENDMQTPGNFQKTTIDPVNIKNIPDNHVSPSSYFREKSIQKQTGGSGIQENNLTFPVNTESITEKSENISPPPVRTTGESPSTLGFAPDKTRDIHTIKLSGTDSFSPLSVKSPGDPPGPTLNNIKQRTKTSEVIQPDTKKVIPEENNPPLQSKHTSGTLSENELFSGIIREYNKTIFPELLSNKQTEMELSEKPLEHESHKTGEKKQGTEIHPAVEMNHTPGDKERSAPKLTPSTPWISPANGMKKNEKKGPSLIIGKVRVEVLSSPAKKQSSPSGTSKTRIVRKGPYPGTTGTSRYKLRFGLGQV